MYRHHLPQSSNVLKFMQARNPHNKLTSNNGSDLTLSRTHKWPHKASGCLNAHERSCEYGLSCTPREVANCASKMSTIRRYLLQLLASKGSRESRGDDEAGQSSGV